MSESKKTSIIDFGMEQKINIAVCKTQMPPFLNIRRVGLTFDLLTWLSIGIIYSSGTIYLPSLKLLEQSVVELSVAQGLRDWHDLWPSLTFDLLTWLSKGIIYSPRTIYLPSLKLVGQSVVELSVAQGLSLDACLWEDRIVFDFVHSILIQASLSYNHIYIFCIY